MPNDSSLMIKPKNLSAYVVPLLSFILAAGVAWGVVKTQTEYKNIRDDKQDIRMDRMEIRDRELFDLMHKIDKRLAEEAVKTKLILKKISRSDIAPIEGKRYSVTHDDKEFAFRFDRGYVIWENADGTPRRTTVPPGAWVAFQNWYTEKENGQ